MEVNSTTTTILSRVTFRDVIWLFPPAFTLHVLKEWPRFTRWSVQISYAMRIIPS